MFYFGKKRWRLNTQISYWEHGLLCYHQGMIRKNKSQKIVPIQVLTLIIIFVCGAVGGYYLGNKQKTVSPEPMAQTNGLYNLTVQGLEIPYPTDWQLSSNDELYDYVISSPRGYPQDAYYKVFVDVLSDVNEGAANSCDNCSFRYYGKGADINDEDIYLLATGSADGAPSAVYLSTCLDLLCLPEITHSGGYSVPVFISLVRFELGGPATSPISNDEASFLEALGVLDRIRYRKYSDNES